MNIVGQISRKTGKPFLIKGFNELLNQLKEEYEKTGVKAVIEVGLGIHYLVCCHANNMERPTHSQSFEEYFGIKFVVPDGYSPASMIIIHSDRSVTLFDVEE